MILTDSRPGSSRQGRTPLDDDLDAYGLTHPGLVRKTNQDHFLVSALRKHMQVYHTSLPSAESLPLEGERLAYLAMVADGVGGGNRGEDASRHAIETIAHYVAHSMRCYYTADGTNEAVFSDALEEAAMHCHEAVVRQAGNEGPDEGGMATTLTLALIVWPQTYILQIGDSRCYLLQDNELTQISRDQTMAQELIDRGVFSRSEADRTRWAHVLSSAIGGKQTAPAVTRIDRKPGDVGLLCSDGLTKHVSDERIAERLRSMTSARQVCEDLLQDALDDGGSDNITVVVGRARKKA